MFSPSLKMKVKSVQDIPKLRVSDVVGCLWERAPRLVPLLHYLVSISSCVRLGVSSHRLAERHPIQSSGWKREKIPPEASWSFQFCGRVAVRRWSAHGGISWDTFCELICWENPGLTITFSSSVILVSCWDLSVCCMVWPCSTKPLKVCQVLPRVSLWGKDQVLKIFFEHLTASVKRKV